MRIEVGSIRQWHWISASLSLAGMLVFAITGITLNHATDITIEPEIQVVEASLPQDLLDQLSQLAQQQSEQSGMNAQLPRSVQFWLAQMHDIQISPSASVEWTEEEIYLAMAGPGVDAWMAIDLSINELSYERTDRGVIAYLNDLHKGRDTGVVWGWFIDIFAIICVMFCVTGLILLYRQANHRSMTWPITVLGLLAPCILLLLFVH
ncbi:PepSY-associated TM helix domain-containing protein [Glaciecola sp. 1036]|uniref:PepSY-associated TM helix domain-containing protein n=1 Tax=Alteromonadaceae TaxID=72275 RepID=UPI003D07BA7C